MRLVEERLKAEEVTTTTIARKSIASGWLYDPVDTDTDGLGQWWINKSFDVSLRTYDGKWSHSTTYKLINVEKAEARYYFNNMDEEDVEGVYHQGSNNTLIKVDMI